ncbi:MAG TPA: hypothetical protein VEB22_13900 [Phycisphaerales bacterium]|nr:hypothetical protein [Phycisphaerales bacterium]
MKVQLVIILFMLLIGGLQALHRWYQKKQLILEAERAERERRDAILRTGRDPLAEQAAAMQRQVQREEAELMAQRQEALRRLREQQHAQQPPSPVPQQLGGGGAGGGLSGGPITRELWPGGPVIVINGPAPAPAQAQRPERRAIEPTQRPFQQPRPQQPQRQGKKQRQQQQQPRPRPQTSSVESRAEERHDEGYYQRERSIARMQASTVPAQSQAPKPPEFAMPTSAQQWRAAFIASEVLGVPVSMRQQGTGMSG